MFVIAGANAERLQEELVTGFTGVEAGALMSHPAISVDAAATLDQARELLARYRYSAMPVTDSDGRAIGMLSVKQIEQTPPSRRAVVSVAHVAELDAVLLVGEHDDVARLLQQPAFARLGHAAVIDDWGRPVGVVSITDLEREAKARHIVSAG